MHTLKSRFPLALVLALLFCFENASGQTCSATCLEHHPQLEDFAPPPGEPESPARSMMNSIFSGTVEHPNGVVQYSKMLIYDPVTFQVISSDWVCLGGAPFSISVPPGIYNVYYRPFAFPAQPYEVLDVNLTANLDTTLVLTPYSTPNYMTDLGWSKVAIFANDNETVSISAETSSSNTIDSIYWFNEFNLFTNPTAGFAQGKIILKDNGLGNDAMAGDGIFTSVPIKYNVANGLYRSGNLSQSFLLFFQVFDAVDGVKGYGFNGPIYQSVGLVNPNATSYAPLTQLNDSVYVSDYVINILRDPEIDNEGDAETVYSVFPDSFDFIKIFHSNYFFPGASGIHYHVQNPVSGIGLPIFNNSSQYGSAGRLQGISIYPGIEAEPPLNHEVLHQWSQFMNTLFNGSPFGNHNGLSTIDGVHGGILEPFTILSPTLVSFNQAVTHGWKSDQRLFANLELYLMGAIDTNEISDQLYLIHDPVYQGGNEYSVSSIDTITPQDIVAEYGYRSPAPQNADTDFKTAFVVISDVPLNNAALTYYTYLARAWADEIPEFLYKSFDEATNFQASMETLLPIFCTSLSTPANGATGVPVSTVLSWTAAFSNPAGYLLRVGTTPGGTDILNNFNVGNVTTYDPPGNLPYNTTIYVSVIAYNAVGNAIGCMEKSFTTAPAPPVPDCTELTAPENGATNVPTSASLNWQAATGNPTGYLLTVGTTPNGTDILDNFDVGNVITYDPPGYFSNTATVYVTIRPYNAAGPATGCLEESFATSNCTANLLIVSLPVAAGTYHSLGDLLSHHSSIANGTSVLFKSDTGVLLEHDFQVDPGGVFEINIEGCTDFQAATGKQ